LERAGMGVDPGEVHEVPVELGVARRTERAHRLEVLVGHGAARREIGAERPELRVEVARADPEHDSTAR
jgi:hypothetical protein